VLVHQLPVGFAVVGMQPRGALLGVLAMSIATTVGYLVGHEWLAGMAVLPLGLFQAFAGGSLLHFVGHRHAPAA
jgi:fatty acid desaturase